MVLGFAPAVLRQARNRRQGPSNGSSPSTASTTQSELRQHFMRCIARLPQCKRQTLPASRIKERTGHGQVSKDVAN